METYQETAKQPLSATLGNNNSIKAPRGRESLAGLSDDLERLAGVLESRQCAQHRLRELLHPGPLGINLAESPEKGRADSPPDPLGPIAEARQRINYFIERVNAETAALEALTNSLS